MATSAFKSTTRRPPITDSSPSSSKPHRRSRSVSRFSRPIPDEFVPTPRRKFVNTVRGSDCLEISLDDLAIEIFSGSSELELDLDDESVSSRSARPAQRNGNGVSERRGRSVSRRNDGGGGVRVVSNADSRRRRSVSVARHRISEAESEMDISLSSANESKSRSMNNGNSRVASYQRPTASSHRRITRSMSQAPQLRSHDGYSSQSSALTDDDFKDARYGRNENEKTIRAVYAQKKIDHPTGDDANLGLREAMRKELRSAVNEIMIELEQNMERKSSASSAHDLLYSKNSYATPRKNYTSKLTQLEKHKQDLSTERALEEQQGQDGFKIVREVLFESKDNAKAKRFSYYRKRNNDRNRVSKRLNEEAEKYFEDFISNVEDTDFSSFDGERSDTSSSLIGTATKQRDGALPTQNSNIISLPVEMEGINLPWLKWDDNDGVPPTTPKTKLWDPSQDLKMIQEHGNRSNSSHGSWNPESASSTNAEGNWMKETETKSPQIDMGKYFELKRTEQLLFDSWRERSVINSGGLLLCTVITPF